MRMITRIKIFCESVVKRKRSLYNEGREKKHNGGDGVRMTDYKLSDKYEKFLRSYINRLERKIVRSESETKKLESLKAELEEVMQMKKATCR